MCGVEVVCVDAADLIRGPLLPFRLRLRLRLHSSSTADFPNRYLHNPWYRKSTPVTPQGNRILT